MDFRSLQLSPQSRSNWICVPPVKSSPGRSGAAMSGFSQQLISPTKATSSVSPDTNQTRTREALNCRRTTTVVLGVDMAINQAVVEGRWPWAMKYVGRRRPA